MSTHRSQCISLSDLNSHLGRESPCHSCSCSNSSRGMYQVPEHYPDGNTRLTDYPGMRAVDYSRECSNMPDYLGLSVLGEPDYNGLSVHGGPDYAGFRRPDKYHTQCMRSDCCSESECSSRSESAQLSRNRPLPPPRPPDRKPPPRLASPADQGYHTLPPWPGRARAPPPCASPACSLDSLTDEMLLKIMSWLTSKDLARLAMTCRRLANLAWDPSLWRSIILKSGSDRTLRVILRRLSSSQNPQVPPQCLGVERILLSENCAVTERGMSVIARKCPELTHLQLQGCPEVNDLAVDDVITSCENLRHLDLTGCYRITRVSSPVVYQHGDALSPGPAVRHLLRPLLLQYLDLSDCAALTDVGLHVTVRSCPMLMYLYLRRCTGITDTGLKFVPLFCSTLRELSLSDCGSGVTDFGLYELARLGASLRYLSVAKCDRVSDAGLKVIARRCYKLRYLNARGCEAVSDDSITILAHSCVRLRALDIGKCDVSDTGLRAIANSCPNLKKLSLRGCDGVGDKGVQCIAYYCRGLQQLNIQDCQVSLEGYRAVKKYCRRCVIEHTNPGFY